MQDAPDFRLLTTRAASGPASAAGSTATAEIDVKNLDQLDHVAIAVSSVADAVLWYRERFRCEVAYEDATWALLRFANTQLALVVPGEHPPHLGFIRDDAEKYGDLRPHRDGTQSVYVLDPAGNAVEILKPYPRSGGSHA